MIGYLHLPLNHRQVTSPNTTSAWNALHDRALFKLSFQFLALPAIVLPRRPSCTAPPQCHCNHDYPQTMRTVIVFMAIITVTTAITIVTN